MAFELENIVPWGRNMEEYTGMFHLTNADANKRIISFGDGPASFNAEMTRKGKDVTSVDPVYRFTTGELRRRINETRDIVIQQTRNNLGNFVWTKIKDVDELERTRVSAMDEFLGDFEDGKKNGRYIDHELPARTSFQDSSFDLGLSSHFLLLYSQLGLEFHIKSMTEMLRVCKEIRIFPVINLDAKPSELLEDLVKYFENNFIVSIDVVDYEFQKNGNKLLQVKRA